MCTRLVTRFCGLAALAGVLALACPLGDCQSSLPVEGRVVAADGLPLSALQATTFGASPAFDLPVIDERGQIAFRARINGGAVTPLDDRVIVKGTIFWDLQVLARGGDAAPGMPGVALTTGTAPGLGGTIRLSPNGDVFFGSFLGGNGVTSANDTALFWGGAGGLVSLAREGDPAPGTGGAALASSFNNPLASSVALNRWGRAAFQSATSGGDTTVANDLGWFAGTPQAIELVQRKGGVALGGAATIGALGALCQINDGGQLLHGATLTHGPAVTVADDETLWIHTPGAGDLLVLREGDAVPGTNGAVLGNPTGFWTIGVGNIAFTRSGQFVVVARSSAATSSPESTIARCWSARRPGPRSRAVREARRPERTDLRDREQREPLHQRGRADPLPVYDLGRHGHERRRHRHLDGGAGALAQIAREGSVAPETGGALFGSLSGTQMSFNDRGQILFTTQLVGAGVTGPGNNTALYSYDPTVGLDLVLRGADAVTVAPGTVKTVSTFAMVPHNGGDGAALGFNHAGDFVLRATMTDGTGAILAGHAGTLAAEPRALSASQGGMQFLRLRGSPPAPGSRTSSAARRAERPPGSWRRASRSR